MKKTIFAALTAILIFTSCEKEEKRESYTVDSNTSKVEWKGYLMGGYFNRGMFSVDETELLVKNGKLQDALFTIPILTLDVLNLEGEAKGGLEAHLKSPDFFNVLVHPNAYFKLTRLKPYHSTGTADGVTDANYEAEGDFTMLGVTKKLAFPARVDITDAAVNVAAILKINRVDWGMNYATDPAAGEHYILPMVDLNVNLTATRN